MKPVAIKTYLAIALAVLCLAITPATRSDSPLFDSGVEAINAGWASFHRHSDGTHWQTYDDFVLPSNRQTWKVGHAQWAGMYFDESAGVFLNGVGTSQTFQILLRADDGTGALPEGYPSPQAVAVIARRKVTSRGAPYLGGVALYSAEFEPIRLEGGRRYWISFVATEPLVPSENGHWSWANRCCRGNSVQGHPGLQTWIRHHGRQHFVLHGEAAEPGVRAMMDPQPRIGKP